MKKLLCLLILILVCLLLCGTKNKGEIKKQTYIVEKGDTLWALGKKFAPGRDIREWIFDVCNLNGIDAGVRWGQQITVLVEE